MNSASGGYFSPSELELLGFRRLGQNVRISKRVEIQDPAVVSISDNVRIDAFVVITTGKSGFVSIGENTHIADSVRLSGAGGITIGRYVGIATKVNLLSSSDDYSGNSMVGPLTPPGSANGKYAETRVDDFAVIGTASTVFPGCSLSEGVAVGAMSLVNKRLAPWGVYSGVPAKFLKRRSQKMLGYLGEVV